MTKHNITDWFTHVVLLVLGKIFYKKVKKKTATEA